MMHISFCTVGYCIRSEFDITGGVTEIKIHPFFPPKFQSWGEGWSNKNFGPPFFKVSVTFFISKFCIALGVYVWLRGDQTKILVISCLEWNFELVLIIFEEKKIINLFSDKLIFYFPKMKKSTFFKISEHIQIIFFVWQRMHACHLYLTSWLISLWPRIN